MKIMAKQDRKLSSRHIAQDSAGVGDLNIPSNSAKTRLAIRPVFPGHVLFFRIKNSVRANLLNLTKCPEFWTNTYKFNAFVTFLMFQFLFVCTFIGGLRVHLHLRSLVPVMNDYG